MAADVFRVHLGPISDQLLDHGAVAALSRHMQRRPASALRKRRGRRRSAQLIHSVGSGKNQGKHGKIMQNMLEPRTKVYVVADSKNLVADSKQWSLILTI